MAGELSDKDWEDLLICIKDKKCTPFIGAGACAGALPSGSQIADQWAKRFDYPLRDCRDLARVAQYLAIHRFEMFPKDEISRQFRDQEPPNFAEEDEPHAVLADLELPVYITTNYDNFMQQALVNNRRNPGREFCCWNGFPEVVQMKEVFEAHDKPSVSKPLVYHLHGYHEITQSMVLTESDYLDFLITLSKEPKLLPYVIRNALAGTSLLFIGYSLADWDFRVLFRGIMSTLGASLGYTSIAVQLPPEDAVEGGQERAQEYLNRYFGRLQHINFCIYWGNARQFAKELHDRWEIYKHAS